MIKLPIFIVMWVLFSAIKLVTSILGLVMVALLITQREKGYWNLPWWTRPWSNPEDWGFLHNLPKWWREKNGTGKKSFYRYYALRNSSNGLRSIELLDLDVIPEKVSYKTNIFLQRYEPKTLRDYYKSRRTLWYFAWQGNRAGFKIVHLWPYKKKDTAFWFFGLRVIEAGPRHFVMKFGWRVEPYDCIKPTRALYEDTGFAHKFLPYRKG